MRFNSDLFVNCIDISIFGIATGFVIGFISWGIGFGIYSVIKWFKMA